MTQVSGEEDRCNKRRPSGEQLTCRYHHSASIAPALPIHSEGNMTGDGREKRGKKKLKERKLKCNLDMKGGKNEEREGKKVRIKSN